MAFRERGAHLHELSERHRHNEEEHAAAERQRRENRNRTIETIPMGEQERKALLIDWNRTVGVSDYTALTTDPNDPESLQRLAPYEEKQLDLSRGVFPKNEALERNHEQLVEWNRGNADPDVLRRLKNVVEKARNAYGNREGWATVTNQHRENGFPEDEYKARVKGFAFAALRDNDIETAYAALQASDLLNDKEVIDTVKVKLFDLGRSDSPADDHAAETMVRLFTPRDTEARAA
jgi:hypothetical protein